MRVLNLTEMMGLPTPGSPPPSRPLVEAQHDDLQNRLRALEKKHRFRPLDPVQQKPCLVYLAGTAIEGAGLVFVRYLRWWHPADRRLMRTDSPLIRIDCVVSFISLDQTTVMCSTADSHFLEPFGHKQP